jgi:hypothetical protein
MTAFTSGPSSAMQFNAVVERTTAAVALWR